VDFGPNQVFLACLDEGIFALGPRLKNKEDAREYIGTVLSGLSGTLQERGRLLFVKGESGYALVFESSGGRRYLADLDEFTLHRLQRILGRRFIILTGFIEKPDGGLECLALTDGLGAVLYAT
jgi:hypothetical protein